MSKDYVRKIDAMYMMAESRVSLESIVYAYWNWQTAESIAQSFPALSHEQVYGAVAFYLANRDETDGYLQKRRIDYENRRKASRENDPMFYQKMADALRKK